VTYRIPSLRLDTQFDRPVAARPLPVVMRAGEGREHLVLDSVRRGPGPRWRLIKPEGLIGLRVQVPESGVRVRLQLAVDTRSTTMWLAALRGERLEDVDESEASPGHRVAEVTAQGRTRAAVVFDRETENVPLPTRTVTFDVAREEFGPTGMLFLGVRPVDPLPEWLVGHVPEACTIGLAVRRVEHTAVEPGHPARVVSGRVVDRGRRLVTSQPGVFVVNPGRPGSPTTVRLRLEGGAPKPGRRIPLLRDGSPALRELRADAVTSSGHDLLTDEVVTAGEKAYRLTLPTTSEPVLVRVRHPEESETTGWFAAVVE